MHSNIKKILLVCLALLLLCSAFAAGYFWKAHSKAIVSINTEEQSQNDGQQMKTYVSKKLGLSFKYPKSYTSIHEQDNHVTLSADESDHWAYELSVTTTSFNTTQEWLDAQPKGSATSTGYEPVLRIGDNIILASVYVVVDYNGNKPIYGKYLAAITIQNGILLEMSISGQLQPEDVPFIIHDAIAIVLSLQLN